MSIKEEVPEEIESFSDHGRSQEEFNPQNVNLDQHSHPTTSKETNPTFGKSLLDLVSPRKTRQKTKLFKDPPKDITLEDLKRIEKIKSKSKKK